MSWSLAVDHALEHWEDVIPDISGFCLKDCVTSSKAPESTLDPKALNPEPRSLDSSELSDSSSEKADPIWTSEEDKTLLEEAQKCSFEWETVAKSFPYSSPRSVRKRWDKLNLGKAKHEWTEEEDKLIMSLYKTHGGDWKKISTYFNGVTSCNIKNRFYGSVKKRINPSNKIEELNETSTSETVDDSAEKALAELSAQEKRLRLQSLYSKASEIENYIRNAKNKIQELVSKIAAPSK